MLIILFRLLIFFSCIDFVLNDNIQELDILAVFTFQWLYATADKDIYTPVLVFSVGEVYFGRYVNIRKGEVPCKNSALKRWKYYCLFRMFLQSGILFDGAFENSFQKEL